MWEMFWSSLLKKREAVTVRTCFLLTWWEKSKQNRFPGNALCFAPSVSIFSVKLREQFFHHLSFWMLPFLGALDVLGAAAWASSLFWKVTRSQNHFTFMSCFSSVSSAASLHCSCCSKYSFFNISSTSEASQMTSEQKYKDTFLLLFFRRKSFLSRMCDQQLYLFIIYSEEQIQSIITEIMVSNCEPARSVLTHHECELLTPLNEQRKLKTGER